MERKRAAKKEFELHMLRRFISHETHGLRIKSIEEGETPDFIIRELTKDISIELTRLVLPDLMKVEKFQEKIVELAWKKFKETHKEKLQVLVNFSNRIIKCAGDEINIYVNELVQIVEEIYLNNKRFRFHLSSVGRTHPINHFIDSISVFNDLDFDNWQPFGAFRVAKLDTRFIENVIRVKEDKIKLYTTKTTENWLLLLANFGHQSSTHDFDYLIFNGFESSFDRIYLYKYMDDSYTRLL